MIVMGKLILVSILFFLSCRIPEKKYKIDYYNYPLKKSEGLMKYNLKEGVWKYYFPNGKISSIITYSHGEMNGETKVYNENGHLSSIAILKNGNFIGQMINYYPNGALNTIEKYDSNGITQDTFKIWFESGKLSEIGKFLNGMIVGKCVFFYENQNIREIRHYDSFGKKDSFWTYYSLKGELVKKESYEADSLLSVE